MTPVEDSGIVASGSFVNSGFATSLSAEHSGSVPDFIPGVPSDPPSSTMALFGMVLDSNMAFINPRSTQMRQSIIDSFLSPVSHNIIMKL
jgi:hypothetical protein